MNGHQPQLFPQDVPPWELDAQATSTVARIVFFRCAAWSAGLSGARHSVGTHRARRAGQSPAG